MSTIDDVYALLQTTNVKLDQLTSIATHTHDQGEMALAMLATLSPFFSTGARFFVDKVYGNDNNDGADERPFATIGKAADSCIDGRHDTIIVLQADTPYAEQVVLDKIGVLLLLSGDNCRIDPGPAATDDTVKVLAANCAVIRAGQVVGRNGHRAIYAYNADAIILRYAICKTDGTPGVDAVVLEECLVPDLGPELSCSHAAGHGLVIKSTVKACHWARIMDVTAHQCGGDGIHIDGNVDRALVRECNVHDNAGYGINVGGSHNVIDRTNHIHGNALGDIHDATGLNKIYDADTSALSIMTGLSNIGLEVMTVFKPITMEKGEKKVIVYQVTEDGVPQECAGFTFHFGVKASIADTAYKIGPITGILSADANGKNSLVKFTIDPGATISMGCFAGIYGAAMYDGAGNKVPLTPRGGVSYILKEKVLD